MPPNVSVVIPETLVVPPAESGLKSDEFDALLAAAQAGDPRPPRPAGTEGSRRDQPIPTDPAADPMTLALGAALAAAVQPVALVGPTPVDAPPAEGEAFGTPALSTPYRTAGPIDAAPLAYGASGAVSEQPAVASDQPPMRLARPTDGATDRTAPEQPLPASSVPIPPQTMRSPEPGRTRRPEDVASPEPDQRALSDTPTPVAAARGEALRLSSAFDRAALARPGTEQTSPESGGASPLAAVPDDDDAAGAAIGEMPAPLSAPAGSESATSAGGDEGEAGRAGRMPPTRPSSDEPLPPAEVANRLPVMAAVEAPLPTDATAEGAVPQPRPADVLPPIVMSVRRLAEEGGREVHLRLEPESLGRVEVRLSYDSGEVRVYLTADAAPTGALLQRHQSDLRTALQAAGVAVGQLTVMVGDGRSGGGRWPGRPNSAPDESAGQAVAAARLSRPVAAVELKTSRVDYRV